MAKQVYDVGGVKVRATDPAQASALAAEQSGTTNASTPTPVETSSGAIPLSTLSAPTPVPLNVRSTPPATEGVALSASLGTSAQQGIDQFTQEQAVATKSAEKGYTNSLDAVLQSYLSTEGNASLTDKAYRDTVDPAKRELNRVNQQILADQESERQRIIAFKENSKGLELSAQNDMIGEIQDKGIQRRAALAITQLAAQGEYQGAKEIADRAVTAALERQTLKNDTLKFIFNENKDQFTKAEQRQFETAQKDRERKANFEEYKLKAQYDQMIKQSDPLYRAQLTNEIGSGSVSGEASPDLIAYTQALENGSATLAQIPQKLRGQVLARVQSTGTNKLLGLLGQYRETVNGLNLFTANTSGNKALVDTLKGQITAVYKQQQQLGTLDNGVQVLVDKIIPDPSKLSISALSNKAQIAAIDKFIANQGGSTPTVKPQAFISGMGTSYTLPY